RFGTNDSLDIDLTIPRFTVNSKNQLVARFNVKISQDTKLLQDHVPVIGHVFDGAASIIGNVRTGYLPVEVPLNINVLNNFDIEKGKDSTHSGYSFKIEADTKGVSVGEPKGLKPLFTHIFRDQLYDQLKSFKSDIKVDTPFS